MNHILGLIMSSALGFLGVNLLRTMGRVDPLIHLVASIGLGSMLSAQIGFYTLFILGEYSVPAVFAGHGLALVLLVIANLRAFLKDPGSLCPKWPSDRMTWLGFIILSLLLLPLWREARFFPFGGWDAWACWNLKAKFIFLGGEGWKHMLDTSMWRSNNQYPFALPLMNAWGWTFTKDPSVLVPMTNTILFSFLTALTMFWAASKRKSRIANVIPALMLFTLPFVNTLSISQYSDIVLAFFLLGTLTSLVAARVNNNPAMALLAGLFCGAMCFTKSEGTFAAVIIAGLSLPYFRKDPKGSWALLGSFLTAAVVSALPSILFQLYWATANVSFINGLTSPDHPITLDRLKAIAMFLALECVSPKWNGLWILLTCGLLLAGTRALRNGLGIVAAFLGIYLLGALVFYSINTHYEILWWLGATLNRILYTILPVVVWWIFAALWDHSDKK